MTVTEVALDAIAPNPHNPRGHVDGSDLVPSIKAYGILEPLVVVTNGTDSSYVLIAGHRRLDGARRAGLTTVPVRVREVETGDAPALMLIENLQRTDLTVRDEARGYARLVELGWKQAQIAKTIGVDPSIVSRRVKISKLPEVVLDALTEGTITQDDTEALADLFALDPDHGLTYFTENLDSVYALRYYSVEGEITRVGRARQVAKMEALVTKAGHIWVDAANVQPRHGAAKTALQFLDSELMELYQWLVVEDERTEEVTVGDETSTVTHAVLWTVDPKPLAIEAAVAEGAKAFSSQLDTRGDVVMVVVQRDVIGSTDPDQPAAVSAEQKREAAEKERRRIQRAEQTHWVEQWQLAVAGKYEAKTIDEWVANTFVRRSHVNDRATAARYLQLDPVEVDYKKARDYCVAFDQAWAEATGPARRRMLLALVIASTWEDEVRSELKKLVGFTEFDPKG